VQLRHPRFIHAQLFADGLHRGIPEVVQRNQLLITLGKAGHGFPHPQPLFIGLVEGVGACGFRRHEHAVRRIVVALLGRRLGRCRLDGRNAHHRALQMLFVPAQSPGEVGQRGFVSEALAERDTRGFDFAPDTADASGPGILAQRVDHGATDAALGKGLELDAPRLVKTLRGVNQSKHAILHQIADLNGVRHRRGHTASQCLDEREAGSHAVTGVSIEHLHAHCEWQPRCQNRAIPNRYVNFLLND